MAGRQTAWLGSGPSLTTGALVGVVQTIRIPVALESLGDTVAAAALEIAGLAGPQLCHQDNTRHKHQQHNMNTADIPLVTTELISYLKLFHSALEPKQRNKMFLLIYTVLLYSCVHTVVS